MHLHHRKLFHRHKNWKKNNIVVILASFSNFIKFISRCQEWRCFTNWTSIKLWLFRWINKRSYRNRNVLPLIKLWYFCCIIERNLPTTLGQGNGPHSVSHWKTALLHDSWDSPVVVILYTKNLAKSLNRSFYWCLYSIEFLNQQLILRVQLYAYISPFL